MLRGQAVAISALRNCQALLTGWPPSLPGTLLVPFCSFPMVDVIARLPGMADRARHELHLTYLFRFFLAT